MNGSCGRFSPGAEVRVYSFGFTSRRDRRDVSNGTTVPNRRHFTLVHWNELVSVDR
jgi:hypothetical protein